MKLFGFTMIRNGVKFDYPFRESLFSLAKITEKVYVALGEGEDETEKIVMDMNFVQAIPTKWDDNLRKGGIILSQQTNVALEALRRDHGKISGTWGFYIQGDEVLHEEDYATILRDIALADEAGCDAVSFRYLHFWQDHHSIAINKKWYPHEIRAVKLDAEIWSWGDAQSFTGQENVYESDATIYHYGHVRDQSAYLSKKADILKRYHDDGKLSKYQRKERRFDKQTEVLGFWGKHPLVMKERMERLGGIWELPPAKQVTIVGDRSKISDQIAENINAHKVYFVSSTKEVGKISRKNVVIMRPNFWQKILYWTWVPVKMRSKLAREWTEDFKLVLKLSERGIGIRTK
jgi:hypothetical protein